MKKKTTKSIGHIIGILVLAHLLTGLSVPYILLKPLTVAPANFLYCGAGMAFEIKLSVALLFAGGVIPVGITIMAWPILRQRCYAMGLWLISFGVANLVLQAMENEHWLSMLFMSQEYARAGAADTHLLQTLGMALRSEWKWVHYTHLLFTVTWMFLLFVTLYRLKLVPRVLAAFGLVAVVLQVAGITLPGLLSYSVPFSMDIYSTPIGLAYLGLTLWLMIKGFKESGSVPGEINLKPDDV